MRKHEAISRFGFDPTTIGLRYRSWRLVGKPGEHPGVVTRMGYLCVETRDGASNPIDPEATKKPNFVGSAEDSSDRTYRYYYYSPLEGAKEASR